MTAWRVAAVCERLRETVAETPPPSDSRIARQLHRTATDHHERPRRVLESAEPLRDARVRSSTKKRTPTTTTSPRTIYLRDPTRTIIATNDSPDVGFEASINPYRGCEHGCIYCYARPTHEYLGLSAGLDFETKILVKEDAPELLREELNAKKWEPKVLVDQRRDRSLPADRAEASASRAAASRCWRSSAIRSA